MLNEKDYIAERTHEVLIAAGIKNWSVSFDRSKKHYGLTHYEKKTIFYSSHWIPVMTKEAINNLVAHEVAHVLEPGEIHSKKWERRCIALGGTGVVRTPIEMAIDFNKVGIPQSKYSLVCPACGASIMYHRKLKMDRSCGACSPGEYNPEFKMNLIQNY